MGYLDADHILPCPLGIKAFLPPPCDQGFYSCQFNGTSLAYRSPCTKNSKKLDESYGLKLNWILTMSSGRTSPLLGTRTSRHPNPKHAGLGSTNSPGRSWGKMVRGPLPLPPLASWTYEFDVLEHSTPPSGGLRVYTTSWQVLTVFTVI